MKLPVRISIPHAGLLIPSEAEPYCRLSEAEIIADSDEGAAEIYDLSDEVAELVSTEVARAIVDLNRADDDRRADGVVKTVTIWNVPIYRNPPPDDVITRLLQRYYYPYHRKLSDQKDTAIRLCVDCHTMAAVGPPIGPDTGVDRPAVCLSDDNGRSLPAGWINSLQRVFLDEFGDVEVTVNNPFSGGYITKTHGRERPWLQIELSRAPFLPNQQKRELVLRALTRFCKRMF